MQFYVHMWSFIYMHLSFCTDAHSTVLHFRCFYGIWCRRNIRVTRQFYVTCHNSWKVIFVYCFIIYLQLPPIHTHTRQSSRDFFKWIAGGGEHENSILQELFWMNYNNIEKPYPVAWDGCCRPMQPILHLRDETSLYDRHALSDLSETSICVMIKKLVVRE